MIFSDKRIIGLDIGESSLKFVELKKSRGVISVANYAFVDLERAEIVSEATRDRLVVEKIREVAFTETFESVSCVVGISGQAVFLRFVKLPAVEKKKMDRIVKYEAQQQVPFPIEEVRWDYQLLGKSRKESRDILLVAIKQDIVRALVSSICSTGLMPEIIDVLPLSVYNCMVFNSLSPDEPSLIIDSGARSTNLIVAEGDNLWIRNIPIAGNAITQCVCDELKVSFDEAEKLKIDFGISAAGAAVPQNLNAAVDRGVSRLFAEMSRSLGFYKSQFGGGPIKKIYITGGSSMLFNFEAALTERFKIPVKRIDPVENISTAIEDISRKNVFLANRHLFCGAVGLALRGISRVPVRINLVPHDIINRRMIVKKLAYLAGAFFTTLLILLSVNVYSVKIAKANATRCKDLTTYINHIEALNRHYKKVYGEAAVINGKIDTISKLMDARGLWMKIFIEIQRVMPPNIWIEDITSHSEKVEAGMPMPAVVKPMAGKRAKPRAQAPEGGGVIIIEGRGIVSIEKDMPQFKDALEKSPLFKDVEIISAEVNNGVVTFVIQLTLEKGFLK